MNVSNIGVWSVGRKLGVGFAAIVFLAVVVGAVGLVAMNTVSQEVKNSTMQSEIVGLADQINIDLLEARRAERNFFLEYKVVGVEQAKNLYVPDVKNFITAVQASVDKGAALAQTQDNRDRFNQIKSTLDDYQRNFDVVVSLTEKRGYGTTGMEGQLVQEAEAFQNKIVALKIDDLTIDALVIRGFGKDYLFRDKAKLRDLTDSIQTFKQTVNNLPANQLSTDDKTMALQLADNYLALTNQFSLVDNQLNEAINQNNQVVENVDKLVKDIRQVADKLYDEAIANTDQTITGASSLELVVLGVAVLLGFGIAFSLSRNISRPLTDLNEAVLAFAKGKLSQRVELTSRDELGVLANAFNQMADNIQKLIESERQTKAYLEDTVKQYVTFVTQVSNGNLGVRLDIQRHDDDPLTILGQNLNSMVINLGELTSQIREATANISSAASEILAATMQQVSGTNEQSAAITQTTTTITEVKTVVEQAFNKAETVAQKALRSNEISQNGQKAVSETIQGMNQIKDKVAGIAENILALSEQTQRIGEITATVNEIAAQSNLLALNASVEAARAGEHGKGFAVVAVEVRNLAEQSKQATAQVKTILNEIQKATNAAVMATEEGTKGVDTGVMLTHETGNTITILSQSIAESANAAQQIVASTKQQSAGMEQIALAMQNINQATIQNLASTRQTERSAQDLSSVAKQLDSLVARYKLN